MKFQAIMHAPINTTMLKSRRYSSDFRPGKNNNSDRRRVCGTSSVFIQLSSVVSCLRSISCLFREPRRVHCGWFCKNSLNTCLCFAESASEWIQARSRFDVPCHKHLTLCSASSATSAIQIRRDRLSAFFLEPFCDLMNKPSNIDPINRTLVSESGPQQVFHGISWYFTTAKQPFIHPYPSLSCCTKALPQGFPACPRKCLGRLFLIAATASPSLWQGRQGGVPCEHSKPHQRARYMPGTPCWLHWHCLHLKRQLKQKSSQATKWILNEKMEDKLNKWRQKLRNVSGPQGDEQPELCPSPPPVNPEDYPHKRQISSSVFDAGWLESHTCKEDQDRRFRNLSDPHACVCATSASLAWTDPLFWDIWSFGILVEMVCSLETVGGKIGSKA